MKQYSMFAASLILSSMWATYVLAAQPADVSPTPAALVQKLQQTTQVGRGLEKTQILSVNEKALQDVLRQAEHTQLIKCNNAAQPKFGFYLAQTQQTIQASPCAKDWTTWSIFYTTHSQQTVASAFSLPTKEAGLLKLILEADTTALLDLTQQTPQAKQGGKPLADTQKKNVFAMLKSSAVSPFLSPEAVNATSFQPPIVFTSEKIGKSSPKPISLEFSKPDNKYMRIRLGDQVLGVLERQLASQPKPNELKNKKPQPETKSKVNPNSVMF